MGVHGGPDIVTEGLVLSLDAADQTSYPGSGTTWSDLSGNGNDSTLEASTMGTVSASLQTIAFKGSGDESNNSEYVTLPLADLKDYTKGSIEFFWKIYSTGYVSPFIMTMSDGSPDNIWAVGVTGANYRIVHENGGSTVTNLNASVSAIELGKHFHVVFTSDGSTNNIYHDGIAQTLTAPTGTNNGTWFDDASSPTTMEVGHYRRSYTSHPLEGEIPICRIYDRALTGKEVLQNFNANKSRFGI